MTTHLFAKRQAVFTSNCLLSLMSFTDRNGKTVEYKTIKKNGLVRDLNPGPLAPKARIIPLDQRASCRFYPAAVAWHILWQQKKCSMTRVPFRLPVRNAADTSEEGGLIPADATFFILRHSYIAFFFNIHSTKTRIHMCFTEHFFNSFIWSQCFTATAGAGNALNAIGMKSCHVSGELHEYSRSHFRQGDLNCVLAALAHAGRRGVCL